MIKNIIFDIGMVLVDFHWDVTMKKLGIPNDVIEHLGKNMIYHPLWHEMDLNIMSESEIVDGFKKINPLYTDYIDLFFNNMEEVITTFDGADTFIKQLKDEGYNIYLLSNYPKRMFEIHKKRFLFYPYVDGEVVSYQCHLIKPDERIYKLLCDKYNLEPTESVFLDDRQENIDTAKALGFEGLVVKDPYKARNELIQFLNIKKVRD